MPRPPQRARRWLRVVLFGAALLAATALGLRWLLQPERLGALLLAQVGDTTGLQLTVATPARLGFWPGLHLELDGLAAGAADDTPLLRVERAELFLPLSVLWSSLQVSEVVLDTPQLDLAALARWRAANSEAGPPQPLAIPAIARLLIRDATIIDGNTRFDGLQLRLDDLAPGETARLRLQAARTRDTTDGLSLELDGVWTEASGLRLQPATLRMGTLAQPGLWRADGELWWDPPQRLDLHFSGELATLPAERLPQWLPRYDSATLAIQHRGSAALDGPLTLALVAGANRLDGATQLPPLLGWLAAADWTRPAPLTATLAMPSLDLDGIHLEGLRLDHDADATD